MKVFVKKLSMILVFLWISMIIVPISADATESETSVVVKSGTCGENVTWEYTSDRVLIISGTGEMDSYTYYNAQDATDAPWDGLRAYVKKIVIEDGVTNVGKSAFFLCTQLEEVVLGDDVAIIREHAFDSCGALKSITIGKGIERIEGYAFTSCTSLLEVYGPDLVTWCGIEFVDIYSNPATVKSVWENNGWVYYDALLYLDGMPVEEELVIPATVSDWGSYSFYDYRTLKTVVFSDGMTSIGEGAFCGCENLTNITLPESVTRIEDGAFSGCGFTSVDIPEGIEKLGNNSFSSCSKLENVTLPSSLSEIGSRAFAGCALTGIDIPESVTVIGDAAFANGLFTEIVVPESVTVIGEGVFSNCAYLEYITLPTGLESIGSSMFYGCSALENIELPKGVKTIGADVFVGCSNLKSIVLSDELEQIGDNAFKDLSNLTNMELPDSVMTVGASAFKNLSNWENAKIPANIETIGEYAYSGCTNLTSIKLPDSVTSIGSYAFENCSGALEITLSENLSIISSNTFIGCSGFESITIPASVQEIGEAAFDGCTNLKSVYFDGDAPSIAESAFNGITATCYYPKENETYIAEITTEDFGGDLIWTYEGEEKPEDYQQCGDNIVWELTEKGVLVLSGTGVMYDYSATDLIYGPWYEQRNSIVSIQISEGITHIGDCAFYECSTATSVTIPSTVISIGDSAFYACGITSISLPEGLTKIGETAFYGTNITDVTIPDNVVEVGISAFASSKLTNVVLSKNMTHIPDKMFNQCHYLYTVEFPQKLISIGDAAFQACFALNSVTLPEGLISIGESAFALCGASDSYGFYYPAYNFRTVTLPSTVQEIGYGAFWRCEYLKTINIPENIKTIGSYAFAYCFDLHTVTFEWNSPIINTDATFIQVKATCYYPSNNPDWNSDIMQNYGGTLTWIGQEMEEPSEGSGGGSGENPGEEDGEDSGESGGTEGDTDSGETEGGESIGGDNSGNTGEAGNGSGGNTGESGGEGTGGDGTGSASGGTGTYTFAIISHPEDQAIKESENAVFAVEATGDGLTYQWQYSNSNGKYWYDSGMTGATAESLTVPALKKRDGQMYRCLVKDTYGNELYSETAVLTINEEATITIVAQPKSQTAAKGTNAVFTIEAEGEGLIYQWQYSTSGKYWFDSGMEGATTESLTVPVIEKRNGQQYRCVIKDSNGNKIDSEIAVLTVGEAFKITTQPESQTVLTGENATFMVEVEGDGLTYQWQYSKNGTYWFDSGMSGSTTNTLSVEAIAKRNGQMYRCVITDVNGNEVISEIAVLNIN